MQNGNPFIEIRSPLRIMISIRSGIKLPSWSILEFIGCDPRQIDIYRIGHTTIRLMPVIVETININVLIGRIGVVLAEVEEEDCRELVIVKHWCPGIPGPGNAMIG